MNSIQEKKMLHLVEKRSPPSLSQPKRDGSANKNDIYEHNVCVCQKFVDIRRWVKMLVFNKTNGI